MEELKINDITAILLAGGKSTRMGEDKGLVLFNGMMMAEHVLAAAKKIASHILIITTNPAYSRFGYTCIEDQLKDRGPLGGIYTGLMASSTQKNIVLGCDMPFLSDRLLKELVSNFADEDVLLTEHKGLAEPLCSVYDKKCAAHIMSVLEQNQFKITSALAGLKTRVISFDKEDWFRGNEFANINSIEELNKYKS